MYQIDKAASEVNPLAFLMGGGEMGSLIQSMDWSKTSLGSVAGWPQSLRTTISICLASDLPICVIWGPGLVQLYNDAYRVICGDKHPHSMGQNFSECWREAWPVIGRAHDLALSGDKAFLETQHIFLERHGYLEECFFTFSFSPIRDELGRVGGLFHPVIEMTAQMLSQRRTRALRDLAAQTSKAKSVPEVLALSAQILAEYDLDLPFVLIYALEPHSDRARLVSATGLSTQTVADLRSACSRDGQAVWPLDEVVRLGSALRVDDVRQRITGASPGSNYELANAALAHPIIPPGTDRPVAILIAGISPRLPMNEAYRGFYDLLASGVTTSVANVGAYEDERRRAKALAELDRAKTAFFSNISHEFRTPLTLMLGPIQEALTGPEALSPFHREQLEVVHRNGLRLRRLVNGLLEFSRIEAGRVNAAFESTDLAEFTANLASNFRSACEKAGLKLSVDCPPLNQPVFVDRSMWEKIVLNLLSNAFKFTFDGEICVTLRQAGTTAEFVVRDSGTGIPAFEMSRLFERFHRIDNARGRTHEGSGIGLALVQELVKLHGGTISAESNDGGEAAGNVVDAAERGTTFRISIPLGTGHLATEQVRGSRTSASPSAEASEFEQEALRWLPDADHENRSAETPSVLNDLFRSGVATQQSDADRPRVLVADDNADMRRYIERLLSGQYRVETVSDGEAALAAVRQRLPDLILTDVMMPRLDGFGLLKALRCDPSMARVPVVLLSARAGEENRVEGMEAGADAYLVKPFSARELLAHVGALLQITRMRQEAEESIRASEQQFRAFLSATSDVIYWMNADWTEMRHLQGRECIADTHEPNRSWMLEYIAPDDRPHVLEVIQAAIQSKSVFELEHRVMRVDGTLGWVCSRAIPMLDGDGEIKEWFGAASDVTMRKQAEAAIREEEGRSRTILESVTDGFFALDADWRFTYMNAAGERFLDRSPRDLVGKSLWAEYPDTLGSEFERVYRRVASRGVSESFTAHYPNLNRWYEVTAYPALNGLSVYFRDVTDRKRLEQERQQFAALVEASPDFIGVAGLDLRCVYVNRAGMKLTGLESDQLANIHVLDFFPESERNLIVGFIAEADRKEHLVVDTWFQHLQTGQLIPVSWSFLRLRDASGNVSGYATVTRDLTERKRHEESTQQTLVAIVERCPFGIFIVDDEFRIASMNQGSRQGAFANVQPIIGRPLDEAMRVLWTEPVAADVIENFRHTLATGESYHSQNFLHARFDVGQTEAYEWELHRIDLPNGRFGAVCYYFDSTLLREAERKLSEADQKKDEFIAVLAHELRNPLAPIRNGLKLMKLASNNPEAVEKARSMMERQVGHMVRLIDDLLDLSRITQGNLELKPERVELAMVIRNAVETSQPLIEQMGHALDLVVPTAPIYLRGDMTRLAQIISNLLNNSAKYTARGGRIRLSAEQLGNEIVVTVKDNGVGIPAHMIGKIFEIFTQVDRSSEQAKSGLGIGLSLVQRLVELHGGSVEAHSEGIGRGSAFVVRLPVVLSLAGVPHEDGELESVPSQPRLRVLVVDDNQDAADSLAMLLSLMGNEAVTVHDGLEALEVAATFRPDVVLLDIGMPRLDGYEVCRRIRQQTWGKGMSLFALTGWGQEEDRRRSLAAGFDAHLVKPVSIEALEQLLAGVLAANV